MTINAIGKLQQILNGLPEGTRTIIINKFSGEPTSKNVANLLQILSKLSEDEKKEFFVFFQEDFDAIGCSLMDGASDDVKEEGEGDMDGEGTTKKDGTGSGMGAGMQ